jgi:hypothetical protein
MKLQWLFFLICAGTGLTLERPLQVRGFHRLREFLFSPGFLPVVLVWSEPFLAQDGQGVGFTLRLLPLTTGGAVPAGIAGTRAD